MNNALYRLRGVCLTAALLLVPSVTLGQAPKSAALATELARLMDQAKVDSIAAKHPTLPDGYIGALYFPGSQLLVVLAKYAAPQLLNEKIAKKDYREVYIDLSSASIAGSKLFVMDANADGLLPKPGDDQAFDSAERGGSQFTFDGSWKKAKMTEAEYLKAFGDIDAAYAKALQLLIGQLKSGS